MSKPHHVKKCRGRGRGFIIIVALISALAGAFIAKAAGHMRHHWHHSWIHGKIDADKAQKRAEYIVNRFARKVDATPEQKKKLTVVAKALVKDLTPLRQKMRNSREETRKLLTQDPINREQIETFRVEKITLADQISKRVSIAFADAAAILTPEQRQKIATRWLQKRSY